MVEQMEINLAKRPKNRKRSGPLTQVGVIRAHLEAGKSITQAEASRDYGVSRLADVIFRIRAEISPRTVAGPLVPVPSRYSKTAKVARYYIPDKMAQVAADGIERLAAGVDE